MRGSEIIVVDKKKKTEEEIEYYSLDMLLSKNATYSIVVGERSNGKTYASLYFALEDYVKNGRQVGIVRRWKEDIIGRRAGGMWEGIVANGVVEDLTDGEYTGIHYWNGKYHLCTYSEEGRPLYNEEDVLGYTFALSDNEHNKSVSFPYIGTIIFDEFITSHLYLKDEFVMFMNTVSTIVRKRTDVKILMLGNTVSRYNPYFIEMGLKHANKMEQGTIDVYNYGEGDLTVAVEYASASESRDENNFYFAFDNPKLDMITDGAWELDLYPHKPLDFTPKDILFIFFIIFDEQVYQCEIVAVDDVSFIFIHRKTTPLKDKENDLIYTEEYQPRLNYSRNVYKPINKIQKKILWYFNTDRVFYQDNEVGDSIDNYLKSCKMQV